MSKKVLLRDPDNRFCKPEDEAIICNLWSDLIKSGVTDEQLVNIIRGRTHPLTFVALRRLMATESPVLEFHDLAVFTMSSGEPKRRAFKAPAFLHEECVRYIVRHFPSEENLATMLHYCDDELDPAVKLEVIAALASIVPVGKLPGLLAGIQGSPRTLEESIAEVERLREPWPGSAA